VSAFLVRAHQARVARHIGGKDRGKTAGRGHISGSPPCFGHRQALIIHDNFGAGHGREPDLTILRSGYILARVAFEIVLAPEAVEDLRSLTANARARVRSALERHRRNDPKKTSRSSIKRLRGIARPQ
jgi:hypothetical protein